MYPKTLMDHKELLDMCPTGIALSQIVFMEDHTPGDLIILELNSSFADMLGLSADAIPGKSIKELLRMLEWDKIREKIHSMASASKNGTETFDYYDLERNHWLKVELKTMSPDTVALFLIDISHHKHTEETLRKNEKRFRILVDKAPEMIFVQTEGRFAYVNQAMVSMLGRASADELLGQPVLSVVHPDYHEIVRERIRTVNESKLDMPLIELVYLKKDGSHLEVESKSVPISYDSNDGSLVYTRSISDRKKADQMKNWALEKERHRQKLEAIGTLASGVAHEINNPLMGILNFAQLILDDDLSPAERTDYTSAIIDEGMRMAGIVHNLLVFSERGDQNYSLVQIGDILESTLSITRTAFMRDKIILNVDIPDNLPSVRCSSQQIQLILTNLLNNARDTLNEKYPGYHENKIIQITCSLFAKDDSPWIRLTVEDHGNGIDEKHRQRLFDPFFSTKGRLNGAGLGLFISYGIAEDHHGLLHFETDTNHFTRFHLDLPVE